jgi:hypothetical protein
VVFYVDGHKVIVVFAAPTGVVLAPLAI